MSRAKLALVLMLLVPAFALAQSAKAPWDNLKKLAPGQQVQVVLNGAKSYSGQFQSVSDNELVLRVGGEQQALARQDILRVSTIGAPHRKRNMLIGAAIGVGAGLGIAAGVAESYRSSRPQNRYFEVLGPLLGAGLGGGGIALGAAIPTGGWHDIYRAR
jgi:hypothetical protein